MIARTRQGTHMLDAVLFVILIASQLGMILLSHEAGRHHAARKWEERNLKIIAQWRATLADARAQEQVLILLSNAIKAEAPHLITVELVEKMSALNGGGTVN